MKKFKNMFFSRHVASHNFWGKGIFGWSKAQISERFGHDPALHVSARETCGAELSNATDEKDNYVHLIFHFFSFVRS